MAISLKNFHDELFREFLEEAAFLYELRLAYRDDPEITWLDLEDVEERLESHIDGLMVGEEPALAICEAQAPGEDPGECYAAIRVFCRQDQKESVLEVLEALEPEASEHLRAVAEALKHDVPDSWQNDLVEILAGGEEKRLPIVAEVLAYRRMEASDVLCDALAQAGDASIPALIHGLGRMGGKNACALLFNRLLSTDEEHNPATALALMRLGDQRAISHCLAHARSNTWPLIPLGLGGDHAAVTILSNRLSTGKTAGDALLAMGLLGDIAAIEGLIGSLDNPETATAAGSALELITGAGLRETVFIPEEIHEDELFEAEREAFHMGKPPVRLDGQPFGVTIRRTSQARAEWDGWWRQNRSRFSPGIRYRNGEPYAPVCLLENIKSKDTPNRIRQLAYEELAIRYGAPFAFETDMPVKTQKQIIADMESWIMTEGRRFRPGAWYFAGQRR